MSRHSHTTARIEKKISKTAKELLIALFPSLAGNAFSLESDSFKSYHGTVYHDEWVIWFGPDYWGEWDEYSCYFQLYSWLIDNTTDFEGIMKANEEAGWSVSIDETPFYSPWRGASRAEIISHCRDLVRAGVTLDRMK
ncbi:hypothetical protein [Atlantibacter subterraneus]|uniref:hypothetical protein n=1 Tax=Atlantibacter subterraneus TaxID=255519 RepID=UPI0028A8F617|nr:hypothetical protein [Atlantibacter subterranea]